MVSKFDLSKTQLVGTVRDKSACKTHLEWLNDSFKHIFGILTKFPIQQPEKTLKNLVQSGRKAASKFDLSKTQLVGTVRDKIACKTHLE